jgi:hypothetical protein
MSITRHISVILPPFSRSSVWNFPRRFHKKSAFVKVCSEKLSRLVVTTVRCFPVFTSAERRLLRLGQLPLSTAVKRNAVGLNAYVYRCIVFIALFCYQNFLKRVRFHSCKSIFSILCSRL